MQINIPELSLILLIGVSSSGKSSFANQHFKATEVVSSDHCRALICDDENIQWVTKDAFEILHLIVEKRLIAGKLTVVDATNVHSEARKSLLKLGRKYHVARIAIIFNLPQQVYFERHAQRLDRHFDVSVIQQQYYYLQKSLFEMKQERFKHKFFLNSVAEVDAVKINRIHLTNNLKRETGPFDIIGDVHGCFDELIELLGQLGYKIEKSAVENPKDFLTHVYTVKHPQNRKVIFVGDLVDRGAKIPEVIRLVMDMVYDKVALCILGNHENKLMRKLKGNKVKITPSLEKSLQQLANYSVEFQQQIRSFFNKLPDHYMLDKGKLAVAHAGIIEDLQGRHSNAVQAFTLFGKTTGKFDEFGLPIRHNWAADYQGYATVVYGHTVVAEAEWQNNTICIDTGCVFGGKLTALRYPEKELISVAAKQIYHQPVKPMF
ncbi:MAG: AAA family ATPase [Thiomargarita sp.]|nr:AAA family ATPase [Thiomargarita sp.]